MRISDWSSDVCSSDLMFGAILDIVAAIGAAEIDVPARSLAAKAAGEREVAFLQRVVRREAVGIDLDDVLVAVRAAAGLADARVAIADGATRIGGDVAERQAARLRAFEDRNGVVEGKRVDIRLDHGGRRIQ